MKRKIFYCLLLFILVRGSLHAQYSEVSIQRFANGILNNIQKIDSQYVAFISNSNASDTYESRLLLYNIHFPGQYHDNLFLEARDSVIFLDGYYTHALKFIADTRMWLMIQSKMINGNNRFYRVILCNELFEIKDQTTVEWPGIPQSFYIGGDSNNTYIIGSLVGAVNNIVYMNYYHSQPTILSPLRITQTEPEDIFYITSMRVDKSTGNLLLFSHYGIYIIDTSLNILQVHLYTDVLTQDFGDVIRINEYYYSHGAKDSSESIPLRNLVIHKYDSNFVIQKADTLGMYNHDNFPFIYNSIDYKDGEIIVGGHYDGPYSNLDFNQTRKKFYLAKYDEQLNLLWKKEYGGDRAYLFVGLRLLEDQSCFAFGFIYDSIEMERYPYGLFVNSDGEIVTSYVGPKQDNIKITIENPGSNTLRLFNNSFEEVILLLFDVNGRIVLHESVIPGINELQMAGVPIGTYYYKLTSEMNTRNYGVWLKLN